MNAVMFATIGALHQGNLETLADEKFPNVPNVSWMMSIGYRGMLEVTFFSDHNEIVGTLILVPENLMVRV